MEEFLNTKLIFRKAHITKLSCSWIISTSRLVKFLKSGSKLCKFNNIFISVYSKKSPTPTAVEISSLTLLYFPCRWSLIIAAGSSHQYFKQTHQNLYKLWMTAMRHSFHSCALNVQCIKLYCCPNNILLFWFGNNFFLHIIINFSSRTMLRG